MRFIGISFCHASKESEKQCYQVVSGWEELTSAS